MIPITQNAIYVPSFSPGCKFDPALQGASYPKTELVCTVTFDDKPYKTLKVITNVINDNGGTKKESDFFNCNYRK